jgi:sulfatase maturation enzyme AslB (radical SAM superfamily)
VPAAAGQGDIRPEEPAVERSRREGKIFLKKLADIAKVAYKIIQIEYFKKKLPIFGSADITNSCNLKCKHCYWWLNRTAHEELSADEWRNIVRERSS